MNNVVFESVGVKGRINARDSKIEEILNSSFTYHYIPDCKISEGVSDIKIIERKMISAQKIEYPRMYLDESSNSRSLVVACEYLMERARQQTRGVYSISSSSVSKDGSAIVFFGGETNLGKTSCSLELAKEGGFNMYSDEKTLINLTKGKIEGGSRNVPLRKEVIRKKFLIENEYGIIHRDSYQSPSIAMMILPHIDHGLKKPIFNQFKESDLFWLVTRELCRRIRGNTKFINDFEYLLPSIDTDELAQKRIAETKMFCKQVPGFYFQGSLKQLIKLIKKEFNVKHG